MNTLALSSEKSGASAVSQAAMSRMAGDHKALAKVGLADVATLGEANAISATAYALMDAQEQAGDLAQAIVDTAKMR